MPHRLSSVIVENQGCSLGQWEGKDHWYGGKIQSQHILQVHVPDNLTYDKVSSAHQEFLISSVLQTLKHGTPTSTRPTSPAPLAIPPRSKISFFLTTFAVMLNEP
ncbi:uncharacterized protein BJ212DRAFT_1297043 [Suillus subaureus]|uniref:Uncharacterized protein n=1 Tax=Suillus subaureus TaxID=48587 RepID=A0A9P7EGZ4_9AGAM|nr:uncharacterized protein BJ212DRAFT_1297043 [Suillus subaureus]KAG1821704.1 hypothetical protein BJ212DRAFT_1297043 [Suillus subaureus]